MIAHVARRAGWLLLGLAACTAPVQSAGTAAGPSTPDAAASAADGASFGSKDAAPASDAKAPTDAVGAAGAATPTGTFVWLTFEVDDSANQTFASGDIRWTGSFKWDQKTNTIEPATSWLPTDGPYPPLWDDGPLSASGHEREGAKAGDFVFSVAVKFAPTVATTIEYGALNEFDNWMWQGPNGALEVPAGATGVLAAKGMVLPKFGGIDVKFALDTAALHKNFAKWTPATHKFFAKGSMNQWTPVQLLDDGQKGDDKAQDGVLTYVHKLNLGKHDGGVNSGEEVQFVFLTTQGDTEPAAGLEYKGASAANVEGVQAWTSTGLASAWQLQPVVLVKESKGKFLNTAIVVPKPSGVASGCVPACAADQTCAVGVCTKKLPVTCTPACSGGATCKDGTCTSGPPGAPTLTAIEPKWAAAKGGSIVKLIGANLDPAFTVTFASLVAEQFKVNGTAVQAAGAGALLVTAPALAVGAADVLVTKADASLLLKLPAALDIVPIDSPMVDGVLGEWHAAGLAATNDVATAWGAGKNELGQAWAAYDSKNMYFGLSGVCEPANAIVVYVDVDVGAGSGVQSPAQLKDAAGALDDAIAGVLEFEGSGWGLDFAFGSVGMATFAGGDPGKAPGAGWRGLAKLDDFAWLDAPVVASASGKAIEASIPLAQLYPGGVPPAGITLQWVAALVNKDGLVPSNQFLPMQPGAPKPTTLVAFGKLRVHPVP
ncbi:MAG: hypothetical protein EXR79_01525 [Myxococcales bacterium]|nr:hypothetical protein [Myxococcales bacterium]